MRNGFPLLTRKSDGFILLSVIISTTLLLTSATAFAWFARTEMRRSEMRHTILALRSAAEIGCLEASRMIGVDKNGYDSRSEMLYSPASAVNLNMGGYKISINIEPLDDKIPVSGLFLPDGVTIRTEYETGWKRIWEYLKKEDIAVLVIDFMDKDDKQKLGGSERSYSINRVVSHLSELKQIPEIDDGVLWGTKEIPGGLDMYLTVYGKNKINVNVARPEVIAILDPKINLSQAKTLVAARMLRPIKSLDDLKKVPGFPESVVTKLANVIGFESNYFRLKIKVKDTAKHERNYRVILQRQGASCSIVRWEE